jgi:hypothetical protein
MLMPVALTLLDYQLKPIACKEFVFWIGEGDREGRKKE